MSYAFQDLLHATSFEHANAEVCTSVELVPLALKYFQLPYSSKAPLAL